MPWNSRILHDPDFRIHGVPATLTLPTRREAVSVAVIDRTAGVTMPGQQVDIDTAEPAADIRVYELVERGVAVDDLKGAVLEFNGKRWRIESRRMVPAPAGAAAGLVQVSLVQL